jgi:hypothetical protein
VTIFDELKDDRLAHRQALILHELMLAGHDIAVFGISGGGVFHLFEHYCELDANTIRKDLPR